MKLGWDQLMESGFDRSLYSDHPPGGTWSARVEQSAWAKLPGIHLFLLHLASGERFWLFVPYSHECYTFFRDLPGGSAVELTVRRGVGGSLARLLGAKSIHGDSNVAPSCAIPLGPDGLRSDHDASAPHPGAATGGAVRPRRRFGRVKRRVGTAKRRRAELLRELPVKRRRMTAPTPSLPLSAFRLVTVWWMDDDEDDKDAVEYIVHHDHVGRFVEATVRLHYAPGINPHAGVSLAVARKITVAEFEGQGPYWWTTPSLQRNGDPRGAMIFRGKSHRTVWRNPTAPNEVSARGH